MAIEDMMRLRLEHKFLIISIAFVGVIWFGDAVFDIFISHEGSFLQIPTNIRSHEPFLRLIFTIGFLALGITIYRVQSRHKRALDALKRQSAAIESSMDGIAIYKRNGEYAYVNQAFSTINGYDSPAELIGKTLHNAYDENELARMEQVCVPVLRKSGQWRGELIAKRKNGSTYFQEASMTLLEAGERVCIIRDITWRKRNEERLRRSERFLNMIFNSIRDPFCIFDNEFRIIRANAAYGALKSKRVDSLIGMKCHEVLKNSEVVCEECVVDRSLRSAGPCVKEKQTTLKNGMPIWVEIYTYPIIDENGKVTHIIEYTHDATARKKSEEEKKLLIERLEHLSRIDSLTGILNRRALADSLLYEVDRAKRYKTELSLVLCDIDCFKEINDTFGHDAGDRALQAVSSTLMSFIRKTDIAGRYGGDEFMLILPGTSLEGAVSLANKLLLVMQEADLTVCNEKPALITLSIGVAGLKHDDKNIDALIKRADEAMYVSKQSGRNRVSYFIPC